MGASIKNVFTTMKEIGADKPMLIYIISYFFYIDGVHTIISMSTSYGTNLGLDSAGMLLALLLAADLNVLCLGEQSAASLGLHIGAARFLGILAAALLAGAAVSFAGLLSFVGLLAPHIARRLVGNNHRILLPAAMLLGAAFVVLCDVLARCLFAPFELPVGILLSLIGGPFFLGLLLHGRGRQMYD